MNYANLQRIISIYGTTSLESVNVTGSQKGAIRSDDKCTYYQIKDLLMKLPNVYTLEIGCLQDSCEKGTLNSCMYRPLEATFLR